jgi:hypothetical protein
MFHVPELARLTLAAAAPQQLLSDRTDGNNGAFAVPSVEPGWNLFMLASDGAGWEHVSVHARRGTQTRTPNWREMCHVKDLFWDDDDAVMQLHPRRADYVNMHPNVLHLWRPTWTAVPLPDPVLV